MTSLDSLPVVIKNITPEHVAMISQGVVAGVDEVGRGPLIGDVVTAAVILDPSKPIVGLNDSKKLSEKRRNALYQQIMDNALSVSIGRASPLEIDELNILHATMLAMQRAVAGLAILPERVLVDGNRVPHFGIASHAIIKGDGLEMDALDSQYPQYGFAKHKGYPTKAHFEALALYGVLPEHRKSFKPVAERILLQDPL